MHKEMSSKASAIKVNNLSKVYPLYNSSNDRLKEALHPLRKKYHHDFYALRDVSFEIEKGETIGIIGQNGSGKSTLLKILSNVLTPTNGSCTVNGKVSSLLELGTGFNPELTGIENVYFNGTLLGFTKEEMDAKLDEILNFADIGDFVRQPVKTYSSGMYVRLAFAVAINVDPDVLIIDEALAVGDVRFQQKCFRKINEFREHGKTILFCSHDTAAVLNFCTRCIWINGGEVREAGLPTEIVQKYMAWVNFENIVTHSQKKNDSEHITKNELIGIEQFWRDVSDCPQFGDNAADILAVAFYDENDENINTLKGGEKVNLAIKAVFNESIYNVIFGFTVKNRHGEPVFGTNSFVENFPLSLIPSESIEIVKFSFQMPFLGNGTYTIDVSIGSGTQMNHIQHIWKYDAMAFNTNNYNPKASFGQVFVPSEKITIIRNNNQ